MRQKIEKIRKLKKLEKSSQFEGEQQNAHDMAEKLYHEVMHTPTNDAIEHLQKFELFAEYGDHSGLEELRKMSELRERRKEILKEMLDAWEKLGGKIS